MKLRLAKLLPLAIEGLVIALIVSPLHEFWHTVAAHGLGVPGYVEYQLFSGHFWFNHPELVQLYQEAIVWAAGGLGVALCFGAMWTCAWWEGRYSKWELDEQILFGAVTIWQAISGIGEGAAHWVDMQWVYYVSAAVATGVIGWLYMGKFIRWMEQDTV